MLFLPLGVFGLFIARLVVGFGDGWVFTAGVTWIVDLAPEERRGQAIGIFGLSIWGGLTFGSLIGEGLYSMASYDAVWAFATLAPIAGLLVSRTITPGVPQRRRLPGARRGGRERRRRPTASSPRRPPPLSDTPGTRPRALRSVGRGAARASRSRSRTSATGRWPGSSC